MTICTLESVDVINGYISRVTLRKITSLRQEFKTYLKVKKHAGHYEP